jgi:hypothetical protein
MLKIVNYIIIAFDNYFKIIVNMPLTQEFLTLILIDITNKTINKIILNY